VARSAYSQGVANCQLLDAEASVGVNRVRTPFAHAQSVPPEMLPNHAR